MLTVFGLGRIPFAPGTWGSLPPVVIALALVWLVPERWMIDASLVLLGLIFAVACVRFGVEAEERFGGKDPQQVVADEVAGQVIPLLVLPWRMPGEHAWWQWNGAMAIVAFITFRTFDILKPPPAHRSQQLGVGWGVLVDDVIAGVYALLATQAFVRFALPLIL